MSTVTKDGKVYQNTALYIDDMGKLGFIRSFHEGGQFRMIMNDLEWTAKSIRPNDYESGTITPAPIVPEDGNWYRVEQDDEITALYFNKGLWGMVECCCDVKIQNPVILSKLTVETK